MNSQNSDSPPPTSSKIKSFSFSSHHLVASISHPRKLDRSIEILQLAVILLQQRTSSILISIAHIASLHKITLGFAILSPSPQHSYTCFVDVALLLQLSTMAPSNLDSMAMEVCRAISPGIECDMLTATFVPDNGQDRLPA